MAAVTSAVCVPALCLFTDRRYGRSLSHRKRRDGDRDERLRGLRNRLWNGIKDIEEVT